MQAMSVVNDHRDQTLWTVDPGYMEQYWAEYESTRPNYGDSEFMDIIYAYHASKANDTETSFGVAHDVACGAGKAGRELANRFEQVIASDSNESSLSTMRMKCQPPFGDNIDYILCAAEEIAQHVRPASADLIAAAECIPILDVQRALDGFTRVLKPNGTLAMWFYGRLHFAEESFAVKCQPLFDRVVEIVFHQVISGSSPEGRSTWAAAAAMMESWLDSVALPSEHWRLVQRRKWNCRSTRMGMGAAAEGLKVVYRSVIEDDDLITEEESGDMWKREFSIGDLRRYVMSCFPGIEDFVKQNTEVGQLINGLAEAMGGEGSRRKITWPISLILATPR